MGCSAAEREKGHAAPYDESRLSATEQGAMRLPARFHTHEELLEELDTDDSFVQTASASLTAFDAISGMPW